MVSGSALKRNERTTRKIGVETDAKDGSFVSGKHYVLYHVKRRLPKDVYNVIGKLVKNEDDVERLIRLGLPKTKAEFLAPFMNDGVRITNRSDDYDYTLAASYHSGLNALIVTYARPNYPVESFKPGTVMAKHIRRSGFNIATGRIKKAISGEPIIFTDLESASESLNIHVLNTMDDYVQRAFKFYKDKDIESLYMYTPDNRLVLLETYSYD